MYALQQIKHTHGIWDEWWYNGEKVNLLTICISLPLSHTHTHTHSSAYCSAQDVLSHSYIKLGSTYAGTLSQMYTVGGSAPPVAVRRCYRSCAEVKKRRAARWGHSVGCVWRRHRKVSSGFLSRLTCSSIGREHHGKQSSAASSPAPGRGHRVPVPRHLETFRQWW